MVTVRLSKPGKSRHVALNDEGQRLFDVLTIGRNRGDLIFAREDGKAWGASHQQRPLGEASKAARLDPFKQHCRQHIYIYWFN